MASLQDIRHRIKSVKNIQQITKAMKMVASARLRRAQAAAVANKPYAEKMYQVIGDIASNTGEISHPLLEVHETGKTLFLIISSDKGLAGAYASNVFKEAKIHISGTNEAQNFALEQKSRPHKSSNDKITMAAAMQQTNSDIKSQQFLQKAVLHTVNKNDLDIITIGRKTLDHFKNRGYNIINSYIGFTERPKYDNAREIAGEIMELFKKGQYKNVYMIYTRFVSAISSTPEIVKLLPFENINKKASKPHSEYIYEPSTETVLGFLLPQYFVTMIYAALLQAAASELSSRMTAMSNATDNAQDLMAKLDLHYNKVRQANITREITEIVGGAEALK
ncbi:ATP synthase F1 subunit gamma [Pectinatus sottacetonis]|uniref:ATP synthase F1 subunit gamma n=1 Tax=Pectinatus sottacetonis TaxID=1002795 RepID=UPI001E32F15F|nr:ATP synthase F1 subunit gamma [Pectinatus sottacetonis]